MLDEVAERIGVATNNVAEYRALLRGLERAAALGAREVEVVNDSELVAQQLDGRLQGQAPGDEAAVRRGDRGAARLRPLAIRSVPRAQNARADALVNAALDGEAAEAMSAIDVAAGWSGSIRPTVISVYLDVDPSASPRRRRAREVTQCSTKQSVGGGGGRARPRRQDRAARDVERLRGYLSSTSRRSRGRGLAVFARGEICSRSYSCCSRASPGRDRFDRYVEPLVAGAEQRLWCVL